MRMNKGIAAVLAALVMGLLAGCAVDAQDADLEAEHVDEASQALSCSRPVQDEDEYFACMSSCMEANHYYAACRRGCCADVTGCMYCYLQ